MTLAVPSPRNSRLDVLRSRMGGVVQFAKDPYRRLIVLVLIMTISRIHQHFRFLNPLRPALTVTMLAAMYAYKIGRAHV